MVHRQQPPTASSRRVAAFLVACLLCPVGCVRDPQQTPAAKPLGASSSEIEDVRVVSLTNAQVNPFQTGEALARVFLFTRADCPISNRYAPEVKRLCDAFRPQGIEFYLVYPDPDQTLAGIRAHMAEYSYDCGAYHDPNHSLVTKSSVSITPEAAVFLDSGELVYRGRIDDRFVDFGKQRIKASQHDLEDALKAIVAGQLPEFRETKAVGCFISDLRPR